MGLNLFCRNQANTAYGGHTKTIQIEFQHASDSHDSQCAADRCADRMTRFREVYQAEIHGDAAVSAINYTIRKDGAGSEMLGVRVFWDLGVRICGDGE